jgi:hypothetical protein
VQTCAVTRRLLPRESATRTFAELLIDCEEDRTRRAVLVGMLREGDRNAQTSRERTFVHHGLRSNGPRPAASAAYSRMS